MIIKLYPAETTLIRSRHSIKYRLESWSGAFEYWSGVLEWNSIIIKIHLNCIIYQTLNRLSEYLCRWHNCSFLSTRATRAGRGVGTM